MTSAGVRLHNHTTDDFEHTRMFEYQRTYQLVWYSELCCPGNYSGARMRSSTYQIAHEASTHAQFLDVDFKLTVYTSKFHQILELLT